MGCPYTSRLFYGIKLGSNEAKKISNELDKLNEDPNINDWETEVGNFECVVMSDENDKKHFLIISEITDVDCCEYVKEVKEKDLNKAKKEADKIYQTSPFLKRHFSKDKIVLLTTCEYIG